MKTLITGIALGAIGYSIYSGLRRQASQQDRDHRGPEHLQRWEDEGGNVPAANTALKTARTDDLLSPGGQTSPATESVAGSGAHRPEFPRSPVG